MNSTDAQRPTPDDGNSPLGKSRRFKSGMMRRRIAGVILLAGIATALVSALLPWLTALAVNDGGWSSPIRTWHLLNTDVLFAVPFAFFPGIWLIVEAARSILGLPPHLSRWQVLRRSLFGIIGTGAALLLISLQAGFETFFPGRGRYIDQRVEVGALVCFAGFGLALLGAALLTSGTTVNPGARVAPSAC